MTLDNDPANRPAAERSQASVPAEAEPSRLIDRRRLPAGVMPARLQQWVIGGIAVVMVAILALAGPPAPKPSTSNAPLAIDPSGQRIEDYQRRVEEQAQRLAAEQAALQQTRDALQVGSLPAFQAAGASPGTFAGEPDSSAVRAAAPAPPISSVSAGKVSDNLVYSRTSREQGSPSSVAVPTTPSTTAADLANAFGNPGTALALPPGFFNPVTTPIRSGPTTPATVEPSGSTDPDSAAQNSATGAAKPQQHTSDTATPPPSAPDSAPRYRVDEGTFIDAVLTNRLDGSFEGTVNAMVSVPVYSGAQVVIPAGARALGQAKAVSAFGQTRLGVAFHRILLPDGRRIELDSLPAMNQAGDVGLSDRVDRHYAEIFGSSIALGLLAGVTQGRTPTGFDATPDDRYRQGVASSLGQSATRVLDRFLNLLPTVIVREGHRLRIYMTRDLDLPAYRPTPTRLGTTNGGL